jgi:pimeloyl-ACP methyl ester carboxylesterase
MNMALLSTALAAGVPADTARAQASSATFTVRFDDQMTADLRRRLSQAVWNDAVTDDWRYGTRKAFLTAIIEYWRDRYDVPMAAARLNSLPHRRAEIDGFGVHYLHFRGQGANPKPLLLMNGWPSSFVEFTRLAPRLASPVAHGDLGQDSFDVVVPALPGFGYSDKPSRPFEVDPVVLFHKLMTEHLGYSRFLAAGTDIGAGVATRLGLRYPESVEGIHVASVADPPLTAQSRSLSEAERDYLRRGQRWDDEEGAYQHLQSTRPQTAAFALADSPVGLASWILEKFYFWSDHEGDLFSVFSPDMLLDNLMVYWATNTIGSSMRHYYDSRHYRTALRPDDRVTVPTAVCMWPKDLVFVPRAWAERLYNVRQYSTPARGGHFPALEATEAYAADLRAFVSVLSTG